ncbi:type VII secretion target [Kitasatospora sp. NPDC089797]|uniref:type VII secretion target n=1 Tax=Kitasatospora sp. NPDC089797 TaxID=3155298 RepID=UPI00343F7634
MPELPGFRVDPAALHRAAARAGETAAPIPDQARAVLDASRQAAAGLRALRCGGALDDCTDAWHRLLTDLHATIGRHAGRLETAAHHYRDADRFPGADQRTGPAPTPEQRRNFVRHFG